MQPSKYKQYLIFGSNSFFSLLKQKNLYSICKKLNLNYLELR
jgi:hypothetical protein